jgi:hypothetical protein
LDHIAALQKTIAEKDHKIRLLEAKLTEGSTGIIQNLGSNIDTTQRLDISEQYSTMNTLILTGEIPIGKTTDDLVVEIADSIGVKLSVTDLDRPISTHHREKEVVYLW